MVSEPWPAGVAAAEEDPNDEDPDVREVVVVVVDDADVSSSAVPVLSA